MSKRNRNLATAFNTEESNEDVTSNSNNNTVTSDVTEKSNNVKEDVSSTPQDVPEKPQEAVGAVVSVEEGTTKAKTLEDAVSGFKAKQERKKKKLTMEDTHTRSTFLLRKDLAKRLEKLASKEPRGFKTEFLNDAIELFLDAHENKK